jgi:hypothetical protein
MSGEYAMLLMLMLVLEAMSFLVGLVMLVHITA